MKRFLATAGTMAASVALLAGGTGIAQADPVGAPGSRYINTCEPGICYDIGSGTWVWDGDRQWDIAIDGDLVDSPGGVMQVRVLVDGVVRASVEVRDEWPSGSWLATVPGGSRIDVEAVPVSGPFNGVTGGVRWGGA